MIVEEILKLTEEEICIVDKNEAMIGEAFSSEWLHDIQSGEASITGKERVLWIDCGGSTICIGDIMAIPPGATIKEQLEDKGVSRKEFADRMDLSEEDVSKLINGKMSLTPEIAVKLEKTLGVPARFWNKLEAIYREK